MRVGGFRRDLNDRFCAWASFLAEEPAQASLPTLPETEFRNAQTKKRGFAEQQSARAEEILQSFSAPGRISQIRCEVPIVRRRSGPGQNESIVVGSDKPSVRNGWQRHTAVTAYVPGA